MQLRLTVNNRIVVKGAVGRKGMLSAIISVLVPGSVNEAKGKASIHAFESGDVSEWSAGELTIGDKIEIHLLPDTDADPPTETRRSSKIPALLFSDPNQARNALAKVHICKENLEGILQAAKYAEPHRVSGPIGRQGIIHPSSGEYSPPLAARSFLPILHPL